MVAVLSGLHSAHREFIAAQIADVPQIKHCPFQKLVWAVPISVAPSVKFKVKSTPMKMNAIVCHQGTSSVTYCCSRGSACDYRPGLAICSARMSSIWKQLLGGRVEVGVG